MLITMVMIMLMMIVLIMIMIITMIIFQEGSVSTLIEILVSENILFMQSKDTLGMNVRGMAQETSFWAIMMKVCLIGLPAGLGFDLLLCYDCQ